MMLPLSERLKAGTKAQHAQVERAGLMSSLLRGRIDRRDYCRLLRNLQVIYAALETALERHAHDPQLSPIQLPSIARGTALTADLEFLHGPDWSLAIPVTAAAYDYVQRLGLLSETWPQGLAAHAYVRYLGDLNGGLLLGRIVRKALRLDDDGRGAAFYRFETADVGLLAQRFREGLNAMPSRGEQDDEALLEEARFGFKLHARLFEQLAGTCAHEDQPLRE